MKKLRNIQIITNKYTECVAPPVDYRIWKKVRKTNSRLRVHLITEGKHKNEMTFQQRAPVKSIVYDSPYIPVSVIKLKVGRNLFKSRPHFSRPPAFLKLTPKRPVIFQPFFF